MWSPFRVVALPVAVLSLAAACASTRIVDRWRNPEVGAISFEKVVAMAIVKDAGRRRVLEDAMAAEIQAVGATAQPAYTFVPDEQVRDDAAARRHFEREGFDGAVMLRVVGANTTQTYVPGRVTAVPVYYRTLWGYYRYWVPVEYDPGYVRTDRNVRVETIVYSVKDEQMVWSGLSETLNPDSARALVRGVAKAVVSDLRRDRLLK